MGGYLKKRPPKANARVDTRNKAECVNNSMEKIKTESQKNDCLKLKNRSRMN
jgi:hypothetical protein